MLIAGSLFFGAAGILFVHLGMSGAEVRLWPVMITVVGWPLFVLAVVSFAFVFVAIAQIVNSRRFGVRELVLTSTSLEVPQNPWTNRTLRVARDAVRSIKETEIAGTRLIEIVFDGGKLALSNRTVGDEGLKAVRAWLVSRG
jgi:hypothetical protein